MSEAVPVRMNADTFLAWAMHQPDGERYELVAGEVVRMAAERVAHARCKLSIARRLQDAVASASLRCEVFGDGMAVQIDAQTIYEPDAMVRCGAPLDGEATKVDDPLIVVEVRSPSSKSRDAGAKLEGYFRLASVRHYLIVITENRTVVHHARDAAGAISTRILRDVPVPLDPPGIDLDGIFA